MLVRISVTNYMMGKGVREEHDKARRWRGEPPGAPLKHVLVIMSSTHEFSRHEIDFLDRKFLAPPIIGGDRYNTYKLYSRIPAIIVTQIRQEGKFGGLF